MSTVSTASTTGTVYTTASVSLDGFIASPADSGYEHLFGWLGNGDVPVPTAQPDRTFHMSAASAALWRDMLGRTGASVVGRRLFDLTGGWGGNPPVGTPHVVVTHRPPPEDWPADTPVPFTFVTDGVPAAVERAKAIAGGKWVSVNGGMIARQCLNAGLLDEIWLSLVPVLLGDGVRFLDELTGVPVELDGPLAVVEGTGVTHLRYRVR
jgi:dihydrofolate reductase